jgi:hypothetical protein
MLEPLKREMIHQLTLSFDFTATDFRQHLVFLSSVAKCRTNDKVVRKIKTDEK